MPLPAIPLILTAASLAGAIFGGQRKQIDVNWLKQHFGPAAVSEEALQLFHTILNSPQGQQLMSNAAEQGQAFQREINTRAAQTGLAGPEGTSGTGIFATSAAGGATDALQRGLASDFYKLALPAAQQMVQSRMSAYLNTLGGYQTPAAATWEKIGQAAGTIGAMLPQKAGVTADSGAKETTMAGPDNAPGLPNEPTLAVNTSSLAPQRITNIPSTAPLLPSFSKLGRFKIGNAVQPLSSGGAFA